MVKSVRQSLHIARDQVDLEVHAIADRKLAKCGHGERMGHQVDLELLRLHAIDGETHAIERDRSLARHVARELAGCAHGEPLRARVAFQRDDLRDAINVSGNQMSTQRIPDAQCCLEIDSPARPPRPAARR